MSEHYPYPVYVDVYYEMDNGTSYILPETQIRCGCTDDLSFDYGHEVDDGECI